MSRAYSDRRVSALCSVSAVARPASVRPLPILEGGVGLPGEGHPRRRRSVCQVLKELVITPQAGLLPELGSEIHSWKWLHILVATEVAFMEQGGQKMPHA